MSQLVFWFTSAFLVTFPYKLRGHYASNSWKSQGSENRKWRRIFAFYRCEKVTYEAYFWKITFLLDLEHSTRESNLLVPRKEESFTHDQTY